MSSSLTLLPPKELFVVDQPALEAVADFVGEGFHRFSPRDMHDEYERELYEIAHSLIKPSTKALGRLAQYVDVWVFDMDSDRERFAPFWHTDSGDGFGTSVLTCNFFGPDFAVGEVSDESELRDIHRRRFDEGVDFNAAVERAIAAKEIKVLKTGTARALKFTKKHVHRSSVSDTDEVVRRCAVVTRG